MVQTVHIARCHWGCAESRSFPADQKDAAEKWEAMHQATHDREPVVYVGEHNPRTRVIF